MGGGVGVRTSQRKRTGGIIGTAVVLGEEGEHLFDLHDLFRRAAEEAEEGFAERLAQNAEAREGL